MQIEVEVKGQRIKRINSPGSVEDTLNYLTCYFVFEGEEWDDTVRTAYFENPASRKRHPKILADDGTCTVPWEALTDKGFVRFSVAGERENYRITTGIESFYNSETVYGGEPSEPPTPSQYDQLIALAEQTKKIAESVRDDADAGKFDGEPGKSGDPGKDGVSPSAKVEQTDEGAVITVTDATGTTKAKLKNGKDGNPGRDATDEQVRTAVEAYMEGHPVQVDTEDIIKLAIKNEASGAVPVVITDSAEMGVQDLEMQGWTEQAQYEGNQLFDKSTVVSNTYISDTSGVALPDSAGERSASDYINVEGMSSVFATKMVGSGSWMAFYDNEKNFVSGNEGLGYGVPIAVPDNATYARFTVRNESIESFMVNEGNVLLPWEPYTGGQPSPSPEYPQEIKNAGKYDEGTGKYQYEVKLTGANLFDISKVITDSRLLINNGDGTLTATPDSGSTGVCGEVPNTLRDFCPELISGETYHLSANTTGTMKQIYLLGTNIAWYFGRQRTITDTDLESTVYFYASGINTEAVISDIMITEVEGADYEPYRLPQTVLLTSDRPLTKWDRLEKRNGQWGWVYKSDEKVLDGTEGYVTEVDNYISDFSSNCYTYISDMVRDGRDNAFMNRLSNIDYSWTLADAIGFSKNLNQLHVRISNADLGTTGESSGSEVVAAMKAYMAQQYEEGNPFVFWYETAEETFVPLSESEQEAMNELYTYYPTTVLSNDVGCEMTIKYIADTKAYIDSKIAAIQAAVVNRI